MTTSQPRTGDSPALAIEAQALVKTYPNNVRALDGLSFLVPAGTIFGLLGPNGAGKSTTVKVLNTLTRPDSGIARVAGLDVVKQPDAVRRAIGCVAQKSGVDINATGRENLTLQAQFYGLRGAALRSRVDALLERFSLAPARRPRGARLFGRHETQARCRDGARPHAARPLPRRADDGPRPGGARGSVEGDRPPLARGRHHRAADDALPRGGRSARAVASPSSIAAVSSRKARRMP